MRLEGTSIIGTGRGGADGGKIKAVNPATGEELEPVFYTANRREIDEAVGLAAAAALSFGKTSGVERAVFLRRIADEIEALGDELTERAVAETALPEGRIRMETARTINQMRLFAEVAEEGSWVDARIDRADPDRAPAPKPDVRSMLRPVGPVVVFGASNFPLALSTAGGDTASALAAGNPVIVKAHPAHPGTAELVGCAVVKAVEACGMPAGVFALLFGVGDQLGSRLVRHPGVRAGGFTGSLRGGRELMNLAAAREEPIPFFAEMGSINPVFILPGALRERGGDLAAGLHAAVTLGGGQFCTNPGLVILEGDAEAGPLVDNLRERMGESPEALMLTAGICEAYAAGAARLAETEGVTELARVTASGDGHAGGAALFETEAATFLADGSLMHEIFGPSTLLVKHAGREQLLDIARSMEGQLTATLHGTEEDLEAHRDLIELLEKKVGRIIFNGYPTGVEVCHAMVHGGPYPATSDGRSSSIGTLSIFRFARPVCFQDFPPGMLPEELRDENALGIWRLVDGGWTKDGW